uniref:Uncharacterized protein n=1 Tax=Arundo donax TaxID=35708 RepID=A0A0A9CD04_ARUDO
MSKITNLLYSKDTFASLGKEFVINQCLQHYLKVFLVFL